VSVGPGVLIPLTGRLQDRPVALGRLGVQLADALGADVYAHARSAAGHRSLVSGERSVRIGFDLLITARRALSAARRLLRAHRSILTVEVVGRRYSLASMRHLAQVVRGAMAAFPSASVGFSPFEEELPTGAARYGRMTLISAD
jgi:hypothetical protein